MTDRDRNVTSGELEDFKLFLDERFRSQHNRFLLYLGIAVGLIRFDVPTSVTVGAIVVMGFKGVVALIFR